jgi:hypothetical protein
MVLHRWVILEIKVIDLATDRLLDHCFRKTSTADKRAVSKTSEQAP